jgi:hypothetical protein
MKIGLGFPENLPRIRQITWDRAYRRMAKIELRRKRTNP